MSTKQAKHTPGLLTIDPNDAHKITSEDWGGIGLVYNEPAENELLMEMARANARHIVACWNAFEPGGVVDEVAEALRACMPHLPGEACGEWEDARAALARLEEVDHE